MDANRSQCDPPADQDPNRLERRRMVEQQIRARGVRDPRVLRVMEEVPRERFLPADQADSAFADSAVPIGAGQTLSQPYMVAIMTAQLEPQPGQRILEIGTGSGYQTAVLARLARQVYTIERIAALQDAARELLHDLGIENVSYRIGDGSTGWPQEAPFDGIMVTAGAPEVPASLTDQLAEGGRLIIPVGRSQEQILTTVMRRQGRLIELPGIACRFVKLIGRQGWPEQGD